MSDRFQEPGNMLNYIFKTSKTLMSRTTMLNISMKARTARIMMLILMVVAIVNVLIVSLLSAHSAEFHQPLDQKELMGDSNEAVDQKLLKFVTFLQINHSFPAGCPDKDIFIITLVISTPDATTRRNAIRNSWASATTVEHKNVLTMFVMGEHPDSRNREGVIRLNDEIAKYKDILKGTFKDERGVSSTLMVLLGIQWIQQHCQRVRYVLIIHDNMFVNYRRLVKVLNHLDSQDNGTKLWIGNVKRDQVAIRNPANPHYISRRQFDESNYPPFCILSAGYVMNIAAARDVYDTSFTHGMFPFIDVLTGLVGRDHNWTMLHIDKLFTTTRMRLKPCSVDRVVTAVAPDNTASEIAIMKQLNNETVLQDCVDPDLELVLPSGTNNKPYLDEVLQLHLDHPGVCFDSGIKKRDIFMVAFINSHPENSDIRNAIRKTWGSERSIDGEFIRVFFILGKQSSSTKSSYIMTEDAIYQDILQADFVDSFTNLTLKIITGLKWITKNCTHAVRYLYQGDEDTFVNFKSIIRYLNELRTKGKATEGLYLGSRIYGKERLSVKREKRANIKKLQVSDKLYNGRYYPTYCSGSGYILSTDVVQAMYRVALGTPLIGVADAFMGILAKRLGVEPVGCTGFKTWAGRVDTCSLRSNDTLTVHGLTKTKEQLYQVWETYTNKSIICSDD